MEGRETKSAGECVFERWSSGDYDDRSGVWRLRYGALVVVGNETWEPTKRREESGCSLVAGLCEEARDEYGSVEVAVATHRLPCTIYMGLRRKEWIVADGRPRTYTRTYTSGSSSTAFTQPKSGPRFILFWADLPRLPHCSGMMLAFRGSVYPWISHPEVLHPRLPFYQYYSFLFTTLYVQNDFSSHPVIDRHSQKSVSNHLGSGTAGGR